VRERKNERNNGPNKERTNELNKEITNELTLETQRKPYRTKERKK